MTSETVREALEDAKGLLNTSELSRKLNKTIVNSSDMTWFELLQNVTPIVIASVEKGKIELTSQEKANLATDIILPLVKDKLPWYIKPFANTLIKKVIDVIVSALNKLFTSDWGDAIKGFFKKK